MNSSSTTLDFASRPRVDSLRHSQVGPSKIFDGDLEQAAALCIEAIQIGRGGKVATANLDFLALARDNDALRRALADCWMVVADGAPVAWLARLSGAGSARRVAGVDLVEEILDQARTMHAPLRVAVYGSTEDTAARAIATLSARYPWARFVASIQPPFAARSAEEEAGDIESLIAQRPHLCLIALGCPRQEEIIARHYARLPSAVWIGVGGTFDFFAARRRRAPELIQRMGLEWSFRLLQEPSRLWRRYLLRDIPALLAISPGCVVRRARLMLGHSG